MSDEAKPVVDLSAVRAAMAASRPVGSPLAGVDEDGDVPAKARRTDGLPEDCPVQALGVCGDVYYYLDPLGQLREIAAGKHGRAELSALFTGRYDWVSAQWPRHAKDGAVTGIRWETATHVLMAACANGGVWSALQRVRGAGAWAGDAGELILHCGDGVCVIEDGRERWRKPARIGRYVYPACNPVPRLSLERAGPEWGQEMLALLRRWPWRRPGLDPALLLGWIGCAMLGAAIPWRPLAWITSEAGGGKSYLKTHVLAPLLGDGALSLADATEAGLRQALGYSALPVILDEAEPDGPSSARGQAIIGLARRAASGDAAVRGSADHQARAFTARSPFLFLSILVQGLSPQDASRIAIMEMLPLAAGAEVPVIDPARMAAMGLALRRRLVQAWPRLPAARLRWAGELGEGYDARARDLYAALLSAAEVLVSDDPEELDAEARGWAERVVADAATIVDRVADWQEFFTHLLSCPLDQRPSGERRPVSEWIERAAGRSGQDAVDGALRLLATVGIGLRWHPPASGGEAVLMVAIANRSPGLARLLDGTRWAGHGGSSPPWVQACRRAALSLGGVQCTASTIWIGAAVRAAMVPLDKIIANDVRRR